MAMIEALRRNSQLIVNGKIRVRLKDPVGDEVAEEYVAEDGTFPHHTTQLVKVKYVVPLSVFFFFQHDGRQAAYLFAVNTDSVRKFPTHLARRTALHPIAKNQRCRSLSTTADPLTARLTKDRRGGSWL